MAVVVASSQGAERDRGQYGWITIGRDHGSGCAMDEDNSSQCERRAWEDPSVLLISQETSFPRPLHYPPLRRLVRMHGVHRADQWPMHIENRCGCLMPPGQWPSLIRGPREVEELTADLPGLRAGFLNLKIVSVSLYFCPLSMEDLPPTGATHQWQWECYGM